MATPTKAEQEKAARDAARADFVPLTCRNMPRALMRRLKIAAATVDKSMAVYTPEVIERGLDVLERERVEAERTAAEEARKREADRKARSERAKKSSPANKKKAAPALDDVDEGESDNDGDESAETHAGIEA